MGKLVSRIFVERESRRLHCRGEVRKGGEPLGPGGSALSPYRYRLSVMRAIKTISSEEYGPIKSFFRRESGVVNRTRNLMQVSFKTSKIAFVVTCLEQL